MFAPDMFSGWGVRTLSSSDRSYNPVEYHLGSVWAVENATIVFGLARFGFRQRAAELAEGLFSLASLYPDYRIPETVGGYARSERAAAYLDLADRVSRPAPPRLIAVGGFSGTGKSTLAARIAPALGAAPGAVVLRTDVVRKTIFAHGQSQPLPAWAYSRAARQTVYAEARREAARAIDAGYVAIVDAVFGEEPERRAIEDLAARAGVTFDGLWLEANVDVLEQRIRQRRGDASEATVDVLLRQMREGSARTTWQRIDASGDAESTAREARRALDHEIAV
jgi:hypothetical protein